VVHDVLHFFGDKAEVDGNQDATRATDAEERREQSGRVMADHCYALALGNAERIESGGDCG